MSVEINYYLFGMKVWTRPARVGSKLLVTARSSVLGGFRTAEFLLVGKDFVQQITERERVTGFGEYAKLPDEKGSIYRKEAINLTYLPVNGWIEDSVLSWRP